MRINLKHLGLVMTTVLAAQMTLARSSGVDAMELEPIEISNSIKCNRMLFKSAGSNSTSVYYIPRIVPGTGVDNERVYNIIEGREHGTYYFSVDLYFPTDDSTLQGKVASEYTEDPQACNTSQVLTYLNRKQKETGVSIETITPSYLTSVTITIPQIKNAAIIGDANPGEGNTDILEYRGKSYRATFLIDEWEKSYIQEQIASRSGLQAMVEVRFSASRKDGSVTVKVDYKTLALRLAADVQLKKIQYVGSADLQAAFSRAGASKLIEVVSEAGSSEASAKEIERETENVIEDLMKNVGMKPLDMPQAGNEQPKVKEGSGGMVSVAAAISYIEQQSTSNFSHTMMAAPEMAVARQPVKLNTSRVLDPSSSDIFIGAGADDPSWVSISAGQTFSLSPGYRFDELTTYKQRTTYLTKSDISLLGLATEFPSLQSHRMKLSDVDLNGIYTAEGRWAPFSNTASEEGEKSSHLTGFDRYYWIREDTFAYKSREASSRMSTKLSSLLKLKIFLSFSNVANGQLFSFKQLTEETPNWSGFYDAVSGRIVITAKKDLGIVRFRERLTEDAENYETIPGTVLLNRYYEKKISTFGNSTVTKEVPGDTDTDRLIKRRYYVFVATKPQMIGAKEIADMKRLSAEQPPETAEAPKNKKNSVIIQLLQEQQDAPTVQIPFKGND